MAEELKACTRCGTLKPLSEFANRASGSRDGKRSQCKGCHSEKWAAYSAANREKLNADGRQRYWANRDKELARLKLDREQHMDKYRAREKAAKQKLRRQHPERVRRQAHEWYKTHNLEMRLRTRFYKAMQRYSATGKTRPADEYGVDYMAIIKHLGPPPDETGDWQVDHIRPLASFDWTRPSTPAEAFAPANHQWLTAFENRSKNARYEP